MPRDRELEQLIVDDLGPLPDLIDKPMFGGLAWMLDGHLLCAASANGMLVRLGKGNDSWALEHPDISQARNMGGWISAGRGASDDDAMRRKLLDAAVTFVGTLPAKR